MDQVFFLIVGALELQVLRSMCIICNAQERDKKVRGV